jgi:acyl carrier protein
MDASRSRSEVEDVIFSSLEDLVNINCKEIDRSKSVTEYGMDSIDCLDFLYQVEDKLDLDKKIEPKDIGDTLSIDNLVNAIEKNIILT